MKASTAYISVGSNRASSSAVCGVNGIAAYGAGRYVALWDTASDQVIYATLPGHEGWVTTLKLLRDELDGITLVSGDSVGAIRIWKQTGQRDFTCTHSWVAHPKSSISAIGVPPTNQSGCLDDTLLTGGSDGIVKSWKIGNKPEVLQELSTKGKLPLDLDMSYLPGSDVPILAMGCTDRHIRIWTLKDNQWIQAISLEGHEDWIRCLSFTKYPSVSGTTSDLLLASGSQDNYIRLWRVSAVEEKQASQTNGDLEQDGEDGLDMLDEFERKMAAEGGGSVQISTKAHVLSVEIKQGTLRFNVTLEALLLGHESGLTNIHWSPDLNPLLLSTASDNSLIIWSPSTISTASADGIWIPSHRFGNVGGRGLSFFGAIWGPKGQSVISGGWNGGMERWVFDKAGESWEPKVAVMGHFGEVQSIAWDPRGEYLLSVSSDQTSRIHGPCSISAPESSSSSTTTRWAEIARPQIHGYDMTDAAWLSSLRFASGADEKVTRVFDAPRGFVESLGTLGVASSSRDTLDLTNRPKGATVPPLGLSNRALGKSVEQTDVPTAHVPGGATDSISRAFPSIPTEEELSTSTLWPEIEKIYEHGYEIISVSASHDGKIVATACKATTTEHAVVRLNSTETWAKLGEPLTGHSLTITRIAFSPDDSRILTCSRDRGWRLFGRKEDGSGYESSAGEEKAHSRMILDCCWSPDGKVFATASRDKSVKLWRSATDDGSQWSEISTVRLSESLTAVDMIQFGEATLLAIGTESGNIHIYEMKRDANEDVTSQEMLKVSSSISHVAAINRLAWRPMSSQQEKLQLASCSDDRSVRVFDITL